MATGVSFKVIGMPELAAKLKAFSVEVSETMEMAGRAAGLPLENGWKSKVPVLTGTYLRSIHTVVGAVSPTTALIQVGSDINDDHGQGGYPFYLEYGTVHMSAQPSATPAFEENKDQALEEFSSVYRDLCEAQRI